MHASDVGKADTVRVLVELGASLEAVEKVNMHVLVLYQACVREYEDDDDDDELYVSM